MGIPTCIVPQNNQCPLCFPANKTPEVIYAGVAGINFDWAADPDVDVPPPTLYRLLQEVMGCFWSSEVVNGYQARYETVAGPDWSQFRIMANGAAVFQKLVWASCITSFVNEFPLVGIAQIFWVPATPSPSIRQCLAALNILPEKDTLAEGYPLDADNMVFRIARIRDNSTMYVKWET